MLYVNYWLTVKMKLNSLTSVQYNMVLLTGRGKGQPRGDSSSNNIWSYPQVGVRASHKVAVAAVIYGLTHRLG